mmetsp:Transcript_66920/g.216297  ORF Transcript_66920/g.216297 Transcript_66920/m.216297 type:complete len:248 (+) Transcript_66920:761-1504(+)
MRLHPRARVRPPWPTSPRRHPQARSRPPRPTPPPPPRRPPCAIARGRARRESTRHSTCGMATRMWMVGGCIGTTRCRCGPLNSTLREPAWTATGRCTAGPHFERSAAALGQVSRCRASEVRLAATRGASLAVYAGPRHVQLPRQRDAARAIPGLVRGGCGLGHVLLVGEEGLGGQARRCLQRRQHRRAHAHGVGGGSGRRRRCLLPHRAIRGPERADLPGRPPVHPQGLWFSPCRVQGAGFACLLDV